jgi:uncharacterized hydrophobic protein (TIGR00271 family)
MASTTQANSTARLSFDPNYLPVFEEKLFIEGPQTSRRLTNFFALLLFATFIATYGVLSDSTATVIGAMIVAPLMGPIMATTAAVVMGATSRALRAFSLTVIGIGTVILFAYILAWVVPDIMISFVSNGEITSRISPGLYALLTALGAGAAGAYITGRSEISDSMGGVAIAISLVPPLCVVGISLQQGRLDAAGGALLLFMTNYLAILFAGGIVFLVMGLGRLAAWQGTKRVRRTGFVLFIVGILIVIIPLSITAYTRVINAIENRNATAAVQQWLNGTSYEIITVKVDDQLVTVTVEGAGELQPLQQLENQVAEVLKHPVLVKLRTISAQLSRASNP